MNKKYIILLAGLIALPTMTYGATAKTSIFINDVKQVIPSEKGELILRNGSTYGSGCFCS